MAGTISADEVRLYVHFWSQLFIVNYCSSISSSKQKFIDSAKDGNLAEVQNLLESKVNVDVTGEVSSSFSLMIFSMLMQKFLYTM
jgi:hypothetical protein